jgi:hypothetical protein
MFKSSPQIEFLCRPEDKGVIAEPLPAKSALPAWFRSLPGVDDSQVSATNNGLTVKRCMPFLDALSLGWIIPLAATVRIEIREAGREVTTGWEFDREMVSNHAPFQVAGNPFEPRPPMKFHNYWTVRTAKGWSCLFLPLLNRPADIVQVFSGVVDTDEYVSPVNFPFVATAPDGVYTLPKGTPLVQVVPFRRDAVNSETPIRSETVEESRLREKIQRSVKAGEGWYRDHARARR